MLRRPLLDQKCLLEILYSLVSDFTLLHWSMYSTILQRNIKQLKLNLRDGWCMYKWIGRTTLMDQQVQQKQ